MAADENQIKQSLTTNEAKQALICALLTHNVDSVKALIQANPDLLNHALDEEGNTALNMAVQQHWSLPSSGKVNRQREVVIFLLQQNADPRRSNHIGDTPLHRASRDPQLSSNIQLLLDKGSEINRPNGSNLTPLHLSVQYYNEKATLVLLENGADVNARNIAGNTPLHIAVRDKDEKKVQLLVDHGADINITNNEGLKPIDIAQNFKTPPDKIEGMLKIVKILALAQKITNMWQFWEMETPKYNSYFQWLPREIVEEVITWVTAPKP